MSRLVLIVLIIIVAGCSSVPFKKTAFEYIDENPLRVLSGYGERLPGQYQVLNSITYEYGWQNFSSLGYIDIQYKPGLFTVVSMNPMGVKFYELKGDREGVTTLFMLNELKEKGGFADAISRDIRRIYFDLIPSSEAAIEKKDKSIEFREESGEGTVVYVFAGKGPWLVEKKYYEHSSLNWRVSYYEYVEKDGKIYPGGIVFHNYKYGYSLTVKLKEIAT